MAATVVTQALERRLVARRLYPVIAVVVVVALAVATGLGADYSAGSWAARIDHAADRRLVAHFGRHVVIVDRLSDLGTAAPVVVAMSALVIALLTLGRMRAAVLAAVAPPVATMITDLILKPLIARTALGQSYPSGHSTAFGAVAFVAVLIVLDQRQRRLSRSAQVIVSGLALGLLGGECVALVAARYHVASDVLGGLCVALVSVLGLALVIDLIADRRARR